ncbi:MAG: MFS transporter [Anaerolineales bacterium]|nr:MFS transporter [Anaerolineales bacterium]
MHKTQPQNQLSSDDKLDFKKILPIFIIVLIDLLGVTIIIPLMPLYATSFNATPLLIGLLGAAYPMMQFIGAPLLGRLSDRFGRKPVLLISQLGTLTGFMILGLATNLWMLFASRLIDGLSGANIATAQAAITDSTTEKNRTQGLGLIGAAFGLGFIIGPVIAFLSLAASGNNYHVPAFIAALFSLISILLTWFWFPETLPVDKRGQAGHKPSFSFTDLLKALSHPAVGLLLVLIFSQQVVFGGYEQLFSLFTLSRLGLAARGNSILFVYIGIIVVAVQGYYIGKWSRKFGERRLIYTGLGLLAIGMLLTALTPRIPLPGYSQASLTSEITASGSIRAHENPTTQNIPVKLPDESRRGWLGLAWILIATIPASIGGGMLQPIINSLITKRIEAGEIGGILGISAALLSGANAVAPVLWGAIFQELGPSWPFIFGSALLVGLLLVALHAIQPGAEVVLTKAESGSQTFS